MDVQLAPPPLTAPSASITIIYVLTTSATRPVCPAITPILALGPAKNVLMTATAVMETVIVSLAAL